MEQFFDKSWAILIGVGEFKYKKYQRHNLVEPKNDIKKIEELLINKCGFNSERLIKIIDQDGTLENIKNVFDDISSKVSENDRCLIFYSGHGMPRQISAKKEIGFLIPHDAKPRGKGVSWATLLEFDGFVKHVNDRIVARQKLFLIDCCFSGIIEKAPEYELQRELSALAMIDAAKNKKCLQIFTASNRDEEILASNKTYPPISIFTESIIRTIENANPKKYDSGFISGRVMAKQARKIVREASIRLHKPQSPQFYFSPFDQDGEFVFRQFTDEEIEISKAKPDLTYEPLEQIIKRSQLLFLFQDQNILNLKRLLEQKFGTEYTLLQLQNLIRESINVIPGVQTEIIRLRTMESMPEGKIEEIINYVVNNIVSLGIRKTDFEPNLIEVIENTDGVSEVRSQNE